MIQKKNVYQPIVKKIAYGKHTFKYYGTHILNFIN